MLYHKLISSIPFWRWARQGEERRRLLRFSSIVIVVAWIVMKALYPFPNFMPPDSGYYIEAAQNHAFVNYYWAIGYSAFLRLVHFFTVSDLVLVTCQYLLLQVTILYFLFTIRYLLDLGKWLFRVMLVCSVLNPLIPQISNYVSSDALFAALSLIWFTQLLWIRYRPNSLLLSFHAIVLILCFMVRFNALYYPFVSVVIILLAYLKPRVKIISVSSILVLLTTFVVLTRQAYRKETDTLQFAASGGWQLAANALYGYAHTKNDPPIDLPVELRDLHTLVNRHMDSLRLLSSYRRPDRNAGFYYLWSFQSPLRVYMSEYWKGDSTTTFMKRWATMAMLYRKYGRWLIMHHPGPFTTYYLWPNLIRYYAPPTAFMGMYNYGNDQISPGIASWFGWKSEKVSNYFRDREIEVTAVFPVLFALINVFFIAGIILYVLMNTRLSIGKPAAQVVNLFFVIWLLNMLFSVFAAPIELRYQVFPFIITFGLTLPLLAALYVQVRAEQIGDRNSRYFGIHRLDPDTSNG